MKIREVDCRLTSVPLSKPFKTALRTVNTADIVYVKITCEDGKTGWGEAVPTHVITGDTSASILYAVRDVFGPLLIGMNIVDREQIFSVLQRSLLHNTSAKAAVDMAIYDLLGQYAQMPLYKLLGGFQSELETDMTVSVDEPETMGIDAARHIANGFGILKIKVGIGGIVDDIQRIREIRRKIGPHPKIRLDANQGWTAKEAVRAISQIEDAGLRIELVEQPVAASDTTGLKYVTDHTMTPIMADESVFSPRDALHILQTRAADLINIKLMKTGGIHQALKINALAEAHGVECMVGSMIETTLGITAAAHFAASQPNVTKFDLDAPLLLASSESPSGIFYSSSKIHLSKHPGLGLIHP